MKKTNRKNSPNRIKCQISGVTRMSNATYLASKGEKQGVTGNVWASFYVSKQSFKELVEHVSEFGFKSACEKYSIDNSRLKKWLRYNGRGGFVKVAAPEEQPEMDVHTEQVAHEEALQEAELATV